jgi:hypothetical protein
VPALGSVVQRLASTAQLAALVQLECHAQLDPPALVAQRPLPSALRAATALTPPPPCCAQLALMALPLA